MARSYSVTFPPGQARRGKKEPGGKKAGQVRLLTFTNWHALGAFNVGAAGSDNLTVQLAGAADARAAADAIRVRLSEK